MKIEVEKVIPAVLHNNHYHDNTIKTLKQQIKKQYQKRVATSTIKKIRKNGPPVHKRYAGKYVDRITKLFQKQDLCVAFKTKNQHRKNFK